MAEKKDRVLIDLKGLVLSLDKSEGTDFWEIWINGEPYPIGFFRVKFNGYPCKANVSGSDIYLTDDRNKGYGSRCVQGLANYYGVISSAASGSTNEQAAGMWKKAGAKKFEIQTEHSDHIYLLYKNDI